MAIDSSARLEHFLPISLSYDGKSWYLRPTEAQATIENLVEEERATLRQRSAIDKPACTVAFLAFAELTLFYVRPSCK